MKSKSQRVFYLDLLNVIAIISVIALHCNGIVHGNPNTRAWNSSLLVECLCYFAVPLFIMISGANLLNYREKYDTKTFFKKRFLKVLIPFIFWSFGMFLWKIYVIHSIEPFTNFKDLVNAIFMNKQETTYYFVWAIIGVYLTMPLLSLIDFNKNKKAIALFLALFFIINSLIPNILIVLGINYNVGATLQIGNYCFFAILGYVLANWDIKKVYRILIYIGAFIGLIYRYFLTYIPSKEYGYVVKNFWGYTTWYCILLSASVFLIIKYLKFNNVKDKLSKIISKISGCSYGVYLIHQMIMYYEKHLLNINTSSWKWRTIGIVSTYLISLIIILILKKIPVIKKLVV